MSIISAWCICAIICSIDMLAACMRASRSAFCPSIDSLDSVIASNRSYMAAWVTSKASKSPASSGNLFLSSSPAL